MKVKRFTAATMREALQQIRLTLGADAILLDTETTVAGVCVTAAIDAAPDPDVALRWEARQLSTVATTALTDRGGAIDEAATLVRVLGAQGVDGTLAARLVSAIRPLMERAGVRGAVAMVLGDGTVATPAPVECFFGPPGDGKTTTIVKLAAAAQRRGARVTLVSTDTRRIGGMAELERYGNVLGVPVIRAASPAELAAALRSRQAQDRVLVDTAGASPGDDEALHELTALLTAAGQQVGRTLVASATQGSVAAARTWATFAKCAPQRCIVTKADAAPAGPMVAQLWQAGLPVSHVTTGRRIPGDIETATPERLADRLLAA